MKNTMLKIKNWLFSFYKPIKLEKRRKRINSEDFEIPSLENYKYILSINFNKRQLKRILKHYKLPISGNKENQIHRAYNFIRLTYFSVIIQKNVRRFFVKRYIEVGGPALKKYSLCTNHTDFFTLEKLETIPINNFFSYSDASFIYGFSFSSIYALLLRNNHPANPYNRQLIPKTVIKNLKKKIVLSKILKIPLEIKIKDDEILNSQKFFFRVLEIFQYMDELGNYTNMDWFLVLKKPQLISFLRELLDIWQYRAQLSFVMKKKISPPLGEPFIGLKMNYIISQGEKKLRKLCLRVIENFIKKGIDKQAKCLGAFYILGAFTLVNSDAAAALPWLYESMRYHNTV